MGQSCVRDCERQAQEFAGGDRDDSDLRGRSGGFPGFSGGPPVVDLTANGDDHGVPGTVPPVPNWFQALRRDLSADAGPGGGGTARTEDALASPNFSNASPRSSAESSARSGQAPPGERSPRADQLLSEISYEGEYLGAMKHGVGRLRMDGNTFEGAFRNDLKHGNGVLTWDDGRQYCGQFEEGMFHGTATMTWPDGRRYCGQYAEDKKHGEGVFSWQDVRRYEGQWVAGKRHGTGIYTNAKGLTRTGTWQVDRPVAWAAPGDPTAALLTNRSVVESAAGQLTERSAAGLTARSAGERLQLMKAAGPPPPPSEACTEAVAPLVEGNKVSNL